MAEGCYDGARFGWASSAKSCAEQVCRYGFSVDTVYKVERGNISDGLPAYVPGPVINSYYQVNCQTKEQSEEAQRRWEGLLRFIHTFFGSGSSSSATPESGTTPLHDRSWFSGGKM